MAELENGDYARTCFIQRHTRKKPNGKTATFHFPVGQLVRVREDRAIGETVDSMVWVEFPSDIEVCVARNQLKAVHPLEILALFEDIDTESP